LNETITVPGHGEGFYGIDRSILCGRFYLRHDYVNPDSPAYEHVWIEELRLREMQPYQLDRRLQEAEVAMTKAIQHYEEIAAEVKRRG
jgi:hypothetical protein